MPRFHTRRRTAVARSLSVLAGLVLVPALSSRAAAYTPTPLNETAAPVRHDDGPEPKQLLEPWLPAFLSAGPAGALASLPLTTMQSETTVGASGMQLVSGFNDFRGSSNVSGVVYSGDSGATLTDDGQLPAANGTQVLGDPVVAAYTPPSGAPVFYYSSIFKNAASVQTMCVHRSTNGGASWAGPFEVTPASISGHAADKEWIAVDPETGRLFLAWSDFLGSATTMRVTYSDDQGATWTASKSVGTGGQGMVLACDPHNSNVYAAWRSRPQTGQTGVAIARSTDNGLTWSSGTSPTPFFKEVVPPYGFDRYNSFPSIAVNPVDFGLEVVYAAAVDGSPSSDFGDVFYRRSTDGGVTFSAPVVLNPQHGTDRPQFFPTVTAASSGRIDVFWYDESAGSDVDDVTDLSYSYSTNFGSTWSSPVPVTPSPFHNEIGNNFSAPNQGDYIDAASLSSSWSAFTWMGLADPIGGSGDDDMVAAVTGTQLAPLRVRPGTVAVADSGCGAADGYLTATETGLLTVPLQNIGRSSLSGITATLTSLTAGVTVTAGGATYPTIAAGASGSPSVPFRISLAANYACGTDARFRLDVAATGTSPTYVEFSIPTGVVSSMSTLFSESFDGVTAPALPAGWTLDNSGCTTCAANNWVTTATLPASAPNAAWVPDATYTSFGRLFGPAVAVPAGTTYLDVSFDFKTDLEQQDQRTAFDAFSFEYQVDGTGSSHFASADCIAFDNRYTHYVVRSSGSSFGDRSGWSGTWGYRTAHVRIPGLAGHTFTPRFSLTTDANTGGSGLWVDNVVLTAVTMGCASCTPTAVAGGDDAAGASLSLRLNGANPVRRSTVLAYSLPQPSSVDLAIYDASGRQVRTLVHGFEASGNHVASFDLRGGSGGGGPLGAGVYLARLTVGGETRTLRLVAVE